MTGQVPIPLAFIVASGPACEVHAAVLASGKCPGRDFLDAECEQIKERGGNKNSPKPTARAKLTYLFHHMATYGQLSMSRKRFKKEMGPFFAFSLEFRNLQIRFACFRDGNNWIITHGFIKPGAQKGLGEWPASEAKRAESIMDEYFRRKPKPTPASRKGKK